MSNFLGPLSRAGLGALLVLLLFQFLFLALTLSRDEEGLAWVRREDDCDVGDGETVSVETEFFTSRLCFEAGDERVCDDYKDADNDGAPSGAFLSDTKVEDAEHDFGAAGGLSATNLFFTIVEIFMVLVALFCGDKVLFCKSDSRVFQGGLMVLDILMILFSMGAAGVASNSDAFKAGYMNCSSEEKHNGYGVGISAFLIFWIIAQVGLLLYPVGPLLGSSDERPSVAFQEKELAGSAEVPDASFAADPENKEITDPVEPLAAQPVNPPPASASRISTEQAEPDS